MANTKARSKTAAAGARRPPAGLKSARRPPSRRWIWATIAALAVIGVLFAVFRANNTTDTTAGGRSAYQVGVPGIGAQAPGFVLPSSTGGRISLAGLGGQTVLLYFQEGVDCEPCWTQLKALQADAAAVKAAGIDKIVSITTQPVNLLSQKARDEGVRIPVLADTSLTVSRAYQANKYGMMGDGMDGHTFVLVGPTGTIEWRADYGGAPKYTMYVPPKQLLADLQAGRRS